MHARKKTLCVLFVFACCLIGCLFGLVGVRSVACSGIQLWKLFPNGSNFSVAE